MSIKVAYRDGVFEPLDKVEGAQPGAIYTAFSDEELRDFLETLGWLKAAEKSFEFWNNRPMPSTTRCRYGDPLVTSFCSPMSIHRGRHAKIAW